MIPALFTERMKKMLGEKEADSFLNIFQAPVKKSIRVNTNKIKQSDFLSLAQKNGWHLSPIPWEENGFFIDRENTTLSLGKTVEHYAGLFYIQEASSMLPVSVLDPKDEDIILDMAAAPGSKTTQLSCRMHNKGCVISNDFSRSRIRALATNIERQGCMNVGLMTMNGGKIGEAYPEVFDKVLLDAPCSGEGTAYKDKQYFNRWSLDNIKKMAGVQKYLIQSAFLALKPGGIMTYSTCTFAPEENEEVVNFLLSRFKGNAQLLSIDSYNGLLTKGCLSWNDTLFDPSLSQTVRSFPQKTKTGGFFVAKIKKKESVCKPVRIEQERNTKEKILKDKERRQYTVFLRKTYNIAEEIFDDYLLTHIHDDIFIRPEKYKMLSNFMRMDRCGTHLFTVNSNYSLKLSTIGAFAIGHHATENVVMLEQDQIDHFLQGRDVRLSDEQIKKISTSYLILKEHRGLVLGTGLFVAPDRIKNQVPRYFVS